MRWTILALLLSLSLPVAAGSLDDIRARGVLRVSVKSEGAADRSEHNDPAHFHKRGLEVELAGVIAARILGAGAQPELRLMKRPLRLAAVADGSVDIGISMFAIDAENRALVDLSDPYYTGGLAVMQKGPSTITAAADLDGKQLVVLQQKSHDPAAPLLQDLDARGIRVQVTRVPDFAGGIALIESGAADGMLAPDANLDAWIADGHPGWRRSPRLTQEHYGVAVRKGDQELLALVNAVIADLRADGRLAAMTERHGLPPTSPTP